MRPPGARLRFCAFYAVIYCLLPALSFAAGQPARDDRAELNRLSLITTDNYRPNRHEQNREFAEFTSSFGLAFFGGIYTSTALDLKGDIYAKLSSPEMLRYFPKESERRKLAAGVDAQVRKRYLSDGVTNEKANAAIRYAVTDLGSKLIERVMEKEGVKDAGRRAKWGNRLLLPFHACMKETRTYKEGMRCLEAFKKDALLNAGLALGYELVRQEMGASYLKDQPANYRACLKPTAPGAETRVKACVAKSVQTAAFAYGQAKLLETAGKQLPRARAAAVWSRSAPAFKKCLDRASDKNGFAGCGDALASSAGAEIAKEAILLNKQVSGTISGAKEQAAVAEAGRQTFLACATKARETNQRDASGTLNLEACAHPVRMEAGRAVALEVIRQNIQKTSGAPVTVQGTMEKEIAQALRDCWKVDATETKNSDCLRTSVQKLVRTLAGYRLGQELPAELLKKEPGLKEDLLKTADACLVEKLKGNLLAAEDVAERVNACAAPLLRAAALKVAAFRLGETLRGKSKDAKLGARLQKELVDEHFANCLGASPDQAKIASCAGALRRDAGRAVGAALFTENYDEFIESGGGLSTYQVSPAQRTAFLASVNSSLDRCLNAKAKGPEADAEAGLSACFKENIETLALHLGGLEFRRQLRENVSRAQVNEAAMAKDFERDLGACLKEKSDPAASIETFVKHIDACKLRLTKRYTLELGRRELAAAAEENIPATPETKGRRDALVAGLTQGFSTCLDRAEGGSTAAREACTAELKREATRTLVVEATRGQSRKLLNTGELPPLRQRELEKDFAACVKKTNDAEACAKEHVREAAKAIAHIKLHHTMADMLGADYPKLLKELAALEKGYQSCLDAIPGAVVDPPFIKATEACGADLEGKGVGFSQDYLKKLLLTGHQSPRETELSLEAALIVPCLDAIAVKKPFDEDFLKRYDPEGTFEIMAKMVGDYINYDADKAGEDYESVMAQVVTDLQAAGPVEARRKLLQALIERGMVDQLLKSMIRAEVKKKLAELPEADRPPLEVTEILLSKELLDKVLGGKTMEKFRPFMAEKILTPLLLEGKSMKASPQADAIRTLKNQVAESLLEHPDFGGLLLQSTVQKKIDGKAAWGVTKWLAMKFKGYRTLYWSEARDSEKGKVAEAYIRDKVIRPQFMGESTSPEEEAARLAEANRLVEEALK
jgi:hypothetical protein